MRTKTTPDRNAPNPETSESPIDGHPNMVLVRLTSLDGRGRQAAVDYVGLAGTDLAVKVSPIESIEDACARLRAGLDKLAIDVLL
ncbi:hypothetical protein [Arthrobacter mobilis]|uniref:Uncharacterized protein n=1 Tax=Arthrobacter mobilis TaxID=2724944 RepID=A0A7X6K6P0_9MICC|nr:hypothetical protein [Arthrobacter mobilis]NKX55298.1 hypothetical protein [Arthrobacter mobilis]